LGAIHRTGWVDGVGLEHFGASAPGPVVYEELGFTAENVAAQMRRLLEEAR